MRRFTRMIPLTVLATALAGGMLAASPALAGAPPADKNFAHVLKSAALRPGPTDRLYWRTQSGVTALPRDCRPVPSLSGDVLVRCPAEGGRSPRLYWRTQSGVTALPRDCRPVHSLSGDVLVRCPAEDGRSPRNT